MPRTCFGPIVFSFFAPATPVSLLPSPRCNPPVEHLDNRSCVSPSLPDPQRSVLAFFQNSEMAEIYPRASQLYAGNYSLIPDLCQLLGRCKQSSVVRHSSFFKAEGIPPHPPLRGPRLPFRPRLSFPCKPGAEPPASLPSCPSLAPIATTIPPLLLSTPLRWPVGLQALPR